MPGSYEAIYNGVCLIADPGHSFGVCDKKIKKNPNNNNSAMACLSSVTSIFFHVLIDFHARPLRSTPRAHTVEIPVTGARE